MAARSKWSAASTTTAVTASAPERQPNRSVKPWRRDCPPTACPTRSILTDNGKVFTARFCPGPGPVLFDRICAHNDIRHILTAPYSPTTTGKVERLHKTMRKEFFDLHTFDTIEATQEALDLWVHGYNTEREHQSIGDVPPIKRFELAANPRAPFEVIDGDET